MTEKKKTDVGPARLDIFLIPGRTESYTMARSEVEASVRSALTIRNAGADVFKDSPSTIGDYALVVKEMADETAGGDLSGMSRTLTAQALTLDSLFSQLTRKAHVNMQAGYLDACETYFRLALKAQAQSRASIEALAKIHQPREQTVRHVHVHEGGQAVVADEFHHHAAGGGKNGNVDGQPHAQSAALPSPNSIGRPVPGSSAARKEKVPHARRRVSGGATRQS